MRARLQRRLHHGSLARVDADRSAHADTGFDGRHDAVNLVPFPKSLCTRAGTFAADIDDRSARLDHSGRVIAPRLAVIEEPAPVAEAVGCRVEDAHDLRLVEPDRSCAKLQGRLRKREIGPLRFRLRRTLVGQPTQDFGHAIGSCQPALRHNAIAAQNDGKATGIHHAARKPDRIAMLALRTRHEADGPNIDTVTHSALSLKT